MRRTDPTLRGRAMLRAALRRDAAVRFDVSVRCGGPTLRAIAEKAGEKCGLVHHHGQLARQAPLTPGTIIHRDLVKADPLQRESKNTGGNT
jgi:hypothetical protein